METAVVANEAPQPKEQAVISDEQKEKQENKKQLENKLLTRLTKTELLERNILKCEAAPTLQATQIALMHTRLRDHLDRKLQHRPTSEELVERNILKANTGKVSGSLQAQQQQLKKQQVLDGLSKRLSSRPTILQLQQQHILDEDVSSNEQ